MSAIATIEEVMRLARQLSALDKLKVIERLAPELEAALAAQPNLAGNDAIALDEQYQRGYEQNPENPADAAALLPHLPLQSEPWK